MKLLRLALTLDLNLAHIYPPTATGSTEFCGGAVAPALWDKILKTKTKLCGERFTWLTRMGSDMFGLDSVYGLFFVTVRCYSLNSKKTYGRWGNKNFRSTLAQPVISQLWDKTYSKPRERVGECILKVVCEILAPNLFLFHANTTRERLSGTYKFCVFVQLIYTHSYDCIVSRSVNVFLCYPPHVFPRDQYHFDLNQIQWVDVLAHQIHCLGRWIHWLEVPRYYQTPMSLNPPRNCAHLQAKRKRRVHRHLVENDIGKREKLLRKFLIATK